MVFGTKVNANAIATMVSTLTVTRQQHSLSLPTHLITILKSPRSVHEARTLHALLLVVGFFQPTCPDSLFGSQLVNVYVNFGCLQDAFLTFRALPNKPHIAWNAILRGLLAVGHFSKAIHFYLSMLQHGLTPDNYTYPLVLKACSSLHALQLGTWVHQSILYNQFRGKIKSNPYVQCAVIDMFVKCGAIQDARTIFEQMPTRDLASWTAIICGTMWDGELLQALLLFKNMISEGLKPDSVIVASILPACGRLEAVKLGMALQGCAVTSGFDTDLYVSNAVMDMYCKCGDPLEAHRVFTHMTYRDVVSWSTLIAGYSQNGLYQESYKLYIGMVNVGLTTNAIVAASVLPALGKLRFLKRGKEMHSFVLKEGHISDVVVGSALIDMYANCGSIKEAESIFECMSDKDIMVWNSMIVGYNLVGDFESAFFTFRRIWGTEHRPNAITLVSILSICTLLGALRQGKEIHGYVTMSGLGLNDSVGNSLLDMYSKCGFLELGMKVFNRMMGRNVITYNTIISACGAHGVGEKGLEFYEQMKEEGIKPNKVTFISLLSACSHSGLLDRGWLLYNSMINDYGIEPDKEHYSCMVDLIGRAGDLDGAYKFITRMTKTPDANILGSLLGACRLHNKVELAELLAERIFKLNPYDPGHYVLLSNLYASGKRWEDMSKVRSMIKDKGLEKKPGSSWIQLGHFIYVFHASSTFHPEFAKIEETLNSLLLVMKTEDCMLTNANDQFLT
ncbi:hypothetical protein VNO78_20599 [Psophocarpus tetragonolobus]|uniref:Pentatricopeptide repeat-containing protein n=1 Tax=Psophocarpus tetragonolobus TaxID=3891 RepID=A0AAN9XHA8_PSOTE